MISIISTRRLREMTEAVDGLLDQAATLEARADAAVVRHVADLDQMEARAGDAEAEADALRARLLAEVGERARLEAEVERLRAQLLLDAEDRVALRQLLKAVRKQDHRRVYVLFRWGAFHSVHLSSQAAEEAAETEGADRAGWTRLAPGAALPPASEIDWRIQALPLGGA
ncbi:hypothetical protein ACFVUW_30070 [Streptomyces xiamenensis]|uniref:hypothetical protein n=1 Tax=Streptomyces xiamenensis TaxID=408015 RepID=UPI0036ED0D89